MCRGCPVAARTAVQLFVNTFDREGDDDALADPSALAGWFARFTGWPEGALPTGLEIAIALAVREGIRGLGGCAPTAPGAAFTRSVAALDLRLVYDPPALRLISDHRLGTALAPLLDILRAAIDDGSWARMKVCQRDKWLYWDSSRNQSARWCSTQMCGSREKAARAYRRRTA